MSKETKVAARRLYKETAKEIEAGHTHPSVRTALVQYAMMAGVRAQTCYNKLRKSGVDMEDALDLIHYWYKKPVYS